MMMLMMMIIIILLRCGATSGLEGTCLNHNAIMRKQTCGWKKDSVNVAPLVLWGI